MTHSLLGEAILIFFFGKYCDSENLKCKQQGVGVLHVDSLMTVQW